MTFQGTLNESASHFYRFVSEDQRMHSLGLGAYSEQGLKSLLEDKGSRDEFVNTLLDPCNQHLTVKDVENKAKDLLDAFTGVSTAGGDGDGGGGEGGETTPYYLKYNKQKNKYQKTEIEQDLMTLAEFWDKGQQDETYLNSNEELKTLVINVRNSLKGYIEWEPSTRGVEFKKSKLYFLDKKDNSRELTFNGDPKISAAPRRPTGAKYNFHGSHNIQSSGIDRNEAGDPSNNYGNIGRFVKHSQNSQEPSQDVVSKLRLSYNKALGYFESGTQSILARLLTDVEAAEITSVDMDNLDGAKFNDIYDPENGNYYLSQFQTGFAIPMTVHNGNPHTFGPNVIGKKAEYKKEKIRVINRAGRSFAKGDVVMCHLIDNEWIISDFGTAEVKAPEFKTGKWSFSKMLADSDAYFKDERYFSDGSDKYAGVVFNDLFAADMRKKFYSSFANNHGSNSNYLGINKTNIIAKLNSNPFESISGYTTESSLENGLASLSLPALLSTLNMENPDVKPSRRYVQSSSFDQLSVLLGGNNSYGNVFGRTNMSVNTDPIGPVPAEKNSEVPLFWGAVFRDGYSSTKARSLLSNPPTGKGYGITDFFSNGTLDLKGATNLLDDSKLHMFNDEKDFSLSQLPADVGSNASPSGEYGSPIESISLLSSLESSNSYDMFLAYRDFLKDTKRYSWLGVDEDVTDTDLNIGDDTYASIKGAYDLKPNDGTSLSFIPLSFAMAGNADKNTLPVGYQAYNKPYNAWDNARRFLSASYRRASLDSDEPADGIEHLWGGMFDREKQYTNHTFVAEEGKNITGDDLKYSGFTNLPWDRYIKRTATSKPAAAWLPLDNEERGANLVGIIAAKNEFGLTGLGTVSFSCDYLIGLNSVNKVSLSVGSFSVLPTFPPVTFTNPDTMNQYGYPNWGTNDCRPHTFGHTSLFVRLFDDWPSKQTIYDTRYFTPLHFLAGEAMTAPTSKIVDEGETYGGTWDVTKSTTASLESIKYQRDVDQIEFPDDFRVPTYGHPFEDGVDNSVVPVDQKINGYGIATGQTQESTYGILRPSGEWRVNPICRGMMVTSEGGFRYFKRVIGLDSSNFVIIKEGEGFSTDDDLYLLDKGVKIKNKSTGTLSDFEVAHEGEGFFPSDFAGVYTYTQTTEADIEGEDPISEEVSVTGYKVVLTSPASDNSAEIVFRMGKVYDLIHETDYPYDHGQVQLTPTNQNGEQGPVYGAKTSSITIEKTSKNSRYNAFYYHVNDVSHVDLAKNAYSDSYAPEQSNGNLQYVNLTISVG